MTCPAHLSAAHALMMPSAEGVEIDVAKSVGFREENIHIVDRNPAIVASLKRRYPLVSTYGVDVDRACERIADKGVIIHAANFDFTSCIGMGFVRTVYRIAETRVLHPRACYAGTVLRGRETVRPQDMVASDAGLSVREKLEEDFYRWPKDMYGTLAGHLNRRRVGDIPLLATDALRASALIGIAAHVSRQDRGCHEAPTVDLTGIYKSGTQTMLWALFRAARYSKKVSDRNKTEIHLSTVCRAAYLDFCEHMGCTAEPLAGAETA